MDDELGLIEHNIVQTYYRILKELKETEKKGDPKVTSEAVAIMAAAVNQYEQREFYLDSIANKIADIGGVLSKSDAYIIEGLEESHPDNTESQTGQKLPKNHQNQNSL